jgi:hypothetical protein
MPPSQQEPHDDLPRPPVDQGFDAVTPAIPSGRTDYNSQATIDAPSYFSRADPLIPRPDTDDLPLLRQDGQNPAPTMARRESLSDIRASNPDLALTGNIISATFTIPHSFAYRKNGSWVSLLPP